MAAPLVLDLETQNTFQDVGRRRLAQLRVSVAAVYDYGSNTAAVFEERELSKLEPRLRAASLLIGFNIRDFDLPVLEPYVRGSLRGVPVLDMMVELERVRGHRVSLQSVAQGTLGASKRGTGWEAVELFRSGRLAELKAYCLEDVRITKEIYEYGKTHGRVAFLSNRDWQTHEIPVTWGQAPAPPPIAERTLFPGDMF